LRLEITGRHIDVTSAMKAYARERAQRLERYFEGIHSVQVILEKAKTFSVAEFVIGAVRGKTLVARASSPDMYSAIDLALGKAERMLTRFKGKVKQGKVKQSKRARSLGKVPKVG